MTGLPSIDRIYETAGNTQIVRIEVPGLDVWGKVVDVNSPVTYILAVTDPERFGPSDEPWGVEHLTFVFGR